MFLPDCWDCHFQYAVIDTLTIYGIQIETLLYTIPQGTINFGFVEIEVSNSAACVLSFKRSVNRREEEDTIYYKPAKKENKIPILFVSSHIRGFYFIDANRFRFLCKSFKRLDVGRTAMVGAEHAPSANRFCWIQFAIHKLHLYFYWRNWNRDLEAPCVLRNLYPNLMKYIFANDFWQAVQCLWMVNICLGHDWPHIRVYCAVKYYWLIWWEWWWLLQIVDWRAMEWCVRDFIVFM